MLGLREGRLLVREVLFDPLLQVENNSSSLPYLLCAKDRPRRTATHGKPIRMNAYLPSSPYKTSPSDR